MDGQAGTMAAVTAARASPGDPVRARSTVRAEGTLIGALAHPKDLVLWGEIAIDRLEEELNACDR
jgi:hypothetical protein